MPNNIDAIKTLDKELEIVNETLNKTLKTILSISKESREVSSNFSKVKVPSDVNSKIEKTATLTAKVKK